MESSGEGPDLGSFDRLGWHLEPGAIEPALLDALENALVRHERMPDDALPSGCPRSWTPVINECRIMNVLACGEPFERLIDHPAILPWMRGLVGEPFRLTAANSITRARGVGLPLHRIETATWCSRPAPRCDQVTAVVWLSDCGPDDGPMVVFEGSHRTGERPACRAAHPAWSVPAHDRAVSRPYVERDEEHGAPSVPWEELPSYREIHVRRGDLLVFAESLWHGAREVRSERVRRSLYLSYSPYHFANWHGIAWSDDLKARVGPARRALLEGPFVGTRFPGFAPAGVPERAEFPLLPDSELGPRVFAGRTDAEPPARRIERGLARAQERSLAAPDELRDVRGTCVLRLGALGERTLVVDGGRITLASRNGHAPDALVEIGEDDLAGLLDGELQATELFGSGRARILGDVRLAMRVASVLLA